MPLATCWSRPRDVMRERVNDALRQLIARVIDLAGSACGLVFRFRIARFARSQERLRRRYGITLETPVEAYGSRVEQSIENAAARFGRVRYAQTSGSTTSPKRIPYTKRRLWSVRWTFIDMFVRCCRAYGIQRKSLYVFGPFTKDNSLTSILLEEKKLPNYLVTLQAPYRVEHDPAVLELAKRYGATAVRLWIITIANPGVLYATNPSTLWLFLNELATDWQRSRQLVCDFQNKPESFDPMVLKIVCRLSSDGVTNRLGQIAASDEPLPLSICAPAVRSYICWTGGYVQ